MKYLTELGEPATHALFICKNRQQVEQAISIIKDNIPDDKRRRGKKLRRSNRKDAPPDSYITEFYEDLFNREGDRRDTQGT